MESARAKWQHDAATVACFECPRKFSLFVRRHHCRACGGVFCSKCCDLRIKGVKGYAKDDPQRVCHRCFNAVKKTNEEDALRAKAKLSNATGVDSGGHGKPSSLVGASAARPKRGDRARTRKFLVIGAPGVGKSSIIHRIVTGEMPPTGEEEESSTSGERQEEVTSVGGKGRETVAGNANNILRSRAKSLATTVSMAAASISAAGGRGRGGGAGGGAGTAGSKEECSSKSEYDGNEGKGISTNEAEVRRAAQQKMRDLICSLETRYMTQGHEYCFVFEEATYVPAADGDEGLSPGGAGGYRELLVGGSGPLHTGHKKTVADRDTSDLLDDTPWLVGSSLNHTAGDEGSKRGTSDAVMWGVDSNPSNAAVLPPSVGFDPRWAIGVHAIIIVYAVNDQSSLACLQLLWDEMLLCGVVSPPYDQMTDYLGAPWSTRGVLFAGASNDVVVALVGNKADDSVNNREVETADAIALAKAWGVSLFEVSAKNPTFMFASAPAGVSASRGAPRHGGSVGLGSSAANRPISTNGGVGMDGKGIGRPDGSGAGGQAPRSSTSDAAGGGASSNQRGTSAATVVATAVGEHAYSSSATGAGGGIPTSSSAASGGGEHFPPYMMPANLYYQLTQQQQEQYMQSLMRHQQQQQLQQQHSRAVGGFNGHGYNDLEGGPSQHGTAHGHYTHSSSTSSESKAASYAGHHPPHAQFGGGRGAGGGGGGGGEYHQLGVRDHFTPQGLHQESGHPSPYGGHTEGTPAYLSYPYQPLHNAPAIQGYPYAPATSMPYDYPHHAHPLHHPFGHSPPQKQVVIGVGGLIAGSEAEAALIQQMLHAGVPLPMSAGLGGMTMGTRPDASTLLSSSAGGATHGVGGPSIGSGGGAGANDTTATRAAARKCLSGLFFEPTLYTESSSSSNLTVDSVYRYIAEEVVRKDGM